jgi:hypothetical protein
MAQAFLMHMDLNDRLLEHDLRRWLDPIVNAPAPPRRRRGTGTLQAVTGGLALVPSEAAMRMEPMPAPLAAPAS